MDIMEERNFKIDRILEEYGKRMTQEEVAQKLGMDIKDVSKVTRLSNHRHTRKITSENRREGEKIAAFTNLKECDFLDKYPLENFQK
jgi:DNA-directed RNA polymerase specialized sigma subunit